MIGVFTLNCFKGSVMRRFMMAMLFNTLIFSALSARDGWYDTMGMAAYKKLCKECHGGPYKGAAMHTKREWTKYFRSGAKALVAAHDGVPEALPLFETSYFKNRSDNLKKFLEQSASDSGVVPGCDGNHCGS